VTLPKGLREDAKSAPWAITDLDQSEAVSLLFQAVVENERLLRACHRQRDRAREAEMQYRVCEEVMIAHLETFDAYAAWVENSDSECSRAKWEATLGPSSVVTAVNRNAGFLTE
jgi:hypothetical protein